jgi:CheY-like chemotaxis protein
MAKVLIADDGRGVRKVIAALLQELRPRVTGVVEAEDADAFRRALSEQGAEIGAVVYDWDLPGLPGAQAAAAIKELCGRDIPVVACLNYGQRKEAVEAGPLVVRDFVVRPFEPGDLRDKVLAVLEGGGSADASVEEASAVLRTIVSTSEAEIDLPFLLHLPSALMDEFLKLASKSRVTAGTTILEWGGKVDALHVVVSGTAEILSPGATEATETVEAGNCFGEIAFMSGEPAEMSVRARTPVEIVSLDRPRLAELLRRQPRMSQYLSILASRRSKMLATRSAPPGGSGLGGSLRSMPFSDLIQMLHSTAKTGELQIEGSGERGSIGFEGGNVVHAAAGKATGEEAFYRLAGWKQGMFFFKAGATAPARTVAQPTMSLLMEAMRRVDEGARAPADAGLDALFKPQ